MPFIEKADFDAAIRDNILDDITEADDTLIDKAIAESISYMKGYLNNRYDVVEIFNKTGNLRDETILNHGINIALYNLHRLINPRKMPAFRGELRNDAKEWLMDVNKGIINTPTLPVPVTGEKDYILYGSNTKRSNQI
jgi:hypothetical protein